MEVLSDDVPALQPGEQHAVVRENEVPRVRAYDERNEERQEQQEQQAGLVPSAVKRDPVSNRIRDHEAERGSDKAVDDRSDELNVIELPAVDIVLPMKRLLEPGDDVA